jgi:hypothetical protein
VLSFSEQTKNPQQLIFLHVIRASYLATYEGILLHLRSVQVAPNWRGLPEVAMTVQHSNGVCPPGELLHHSLALVDLSG